VGTGSVHCLGGVHGGSLRVPHLSCHPDVSSGSEVHRDISEAREADASPHFGRGRRTYIVRVGGSYAQGRWVRRGYGLQWFGWLGTHRRAAESFDMVVTDSRMPGMTGSEFVRRLRKQNPTLPIIHLSIRAFFAVIS
jgi:CheY-like chemotaxis protein